MSQIALSEPPRARARPIKAVHPAGSKRDQHAEAAGTRECPPLPPGGGAVQAAAAVASSWGRSAPRICLIRALAWLRVAGSLYSRPRSRARRSSRRTCLLVGASLSPWTSLTSAIALAIAAEAALRVFGTSISRPSSRARSTISWRWRALGPWNLVVVVVVVVVLAIWWLPSEVVDGTPTQTGATGRERNRSTSGRCPQGIAGAQRRAAGR